MDLEELKRSLTSIEGVTGVGESNGKLRVYVNKNTHPAKTRIDVMNLLKKARTGVNVEFIEADPALLQKKDEPKYEGLTTAQFWMREKDCLEIAAPGNQTPEKQAEIHAKLMAEQAQVKKEDDKKKLPWDDKNGKYEDVQFDLFGKNSDCGCGHKHDEDHGHLDDSHDD